jgi:hypothetical protein
MWVPMSASARSQELEAEQIAVQLTAHEEVGDGVDVGAEREVLVDRLDAQRLGIGRAREADHPAVEPDPPGGRGERARDDLDQGRLAGPVVAEQAHDLAAADREADLVQRHDRPEALAQAFDLQQGLCRGRRGIGHQRIGFRVLRGRRGFAPPPASKSRRRRGVQPKARRSAAMRAEGPVQVQPVREWVEIGIN